MPLRLPFVHLNRPQPLISLQTGGKDWNAFAGRVAGFLDQDVIRMEIDGVPVNGYRSPDSHALWIRDHSDIVRCGRYLHGGTRSPVDCFAQAQAKSGRVFDFVTTFSEKPWERENWEKWVRVPVEADVEFRFVKAAYLAWQATSDHAWMQERLPALDLALSYLVSHPLRWDKGTGLVKRPYTIDTWDFDYTAGKAPWLNFAITADTFWGIFHGDNSGVYEAASLLAGLYEHAGNPERARQWRDTAGGIRRRGNDLLFNSRFYTHFHKLTEVEIDGVDEAEQLSMGNPMALNRGMATPEIAEAVIREYQRRRETTGAFVEWFSIDPPFPDGIFGDELLKAGAYINGGIYPLAGGELARAALENGFEAYGAGILDQYREMVARTGETYLWYFPDGTPSSVETSTSPDATPTDGWGSSAMLWALIEGLAGVKDRSHGFRHVDLTPRWPAAGEDEASLELSYADSGRGFRYRYQHDPAASSMRIDAEGDHTEFMHVAVLLPESATAAGVKVNGREAEFERKSCRDSSYACFEVRGRRARAEVSYSKQ